MTTAADLTFHTPDTNRVSYALDSAGLMVVRLHIPAQKRVWTLEVAPRITRDDIRHWMPWSRARFADAEPAASRELYDSASGAEVRLALRSDPHDEILRPWSEAPDVPEDFYNRIRL